MKWNRYIATGLVCLAFPAALNAQEPVPVSQEPVHRPVLVNKYIRLLDVWLPAGDTTLFHIHATPSLFVILTDNLTTAQAKGESWVSSRSQPGTTWYRSFSPDILVHRVCNIDATPFHVNDIELLAPFHTNDTKIEPLPLPLLFENEKAFAYRLKNDSINTNLVKARGPMIAEPITCSELVFYNAGNNQTIKMNEGKYLYIEPGTSFYFRSSGTKETDLVLFEIK